jgi:hypothetical protein
MDNVDQLRAERNLLRLEVLNLRRQMKILDRRIFMAQRSQGSLHARACLEGLGTTGRMTARQLSRVTAMAPSTVIGALTRLIRLGQVRVVCYEPQAKGMPAAVYAAVTGRKNEGIEDDDGRLCEGEGESDPLPDSLSHTPDEG